MNLVLCIAVIVLLGNNNVHGNTDMTDTTLNVDEMLTQPTTTEIPTTVGCSSCATIAEETALESKISNVCINNSRIYSKKPKNLLLFEFFFLLFFANQIDIAM